jgi:hypothetical protein
VSHDYAGCISLPRKLLLGIKHRGQSTTRSSSDGRLSAGLQQQQQQQQQQEQQQEQQQPEYFLVQQPLRELESLRSGRGLRLKGIVLPSGRPW